MTQGYERGVQAKRTGRHGYTVNPYPEWCAEAKRFDAGRDGKSAPT